MLNFKEAVEKNDIKAVKEYLENIDLSTEDNWTICRASELGHIEVVRLLLSDSRVDPSNGNNNWTICMASKNGHTEIVRLLLSDSRVNFYAIVNEEMKEQMLKEERNKLRKEFSFRYYVIQQASPQISIEGKRKSKIPSDLIRKIVYEALYEVRPLIRLVALKQILDV